MGGVCGAVARPLVVVSFWVGGRTAETSATVIVFVAATIGLLVGGVSSGLGGAVGRRWVAPAVGAASGAALGLVATLVTWLPLCIFTWENGTSTAPIYQGGGNQPTMVTYLALMAAAGALPGAIGALCGLWAGLPARAGNTAADRRD